MYISHIYKSSTILNIEKPGESDPRKYLGPAREELVKMIIDKNDPSGFYPGVSQIVFACRDGFLPDFSKGHPVCLQ
jgi:hypothetical protein